MFDQDTAASELTKATSTAMTGVVPDPSGDEHDFCRVCTQNSTRYGMKRPDWQLGPGTSYTGLESSGIRSSFCDFHHGVYQRNAASYKRSDDTDIFRTLSALKIHPVLSNEDIAQILIAAQKAEEAEEEMTFKEVVKHAARYRLASLMTRIRDPGIQSTDAQMYCLHHYSERPE